MNKRIDRFVRKIQKQHGKNVFKVKTTNNKNSLLPEIVLAVHNTIDPFVQAGLDVLHKTRFLGLFWKSQLPKVNYTQIPDY